MPDYYFPEVNTDGQFTDPKVIADIQAKAKSSIDAVVPPNGTEGHALVKTSTGTKWGSVESPYELRGTGFPEGKVTANPGTYYTDTDVTNGAWRWFKKTGTGNTGWVVQDGDTGWREITATAVDPAASQPGGRIFVRRLSPALASIRVLGLAPLSVDGVPMVETDWLPSGFRNQGPVMFYLTDLGRGESKGGVAARLGNSAWWKYARPLKINTTTAADAKGEVVFTTTDPWPSTLPGTAA